MKRLYELRKQEKLSRREVAEKIGLTPQALRHYEIGEREPSIETLKKLSILFNVSIDFLLDNEIEGKTIYSEKQRQAIMGIIKLSDKNLDLLNVYIKALNDTQSALETAND